MDIRTVEWKNGCIRMIDQTSLPQALRYIYIKDLKSLWRAIKRMQVRGAPALGGAAGLGVYLGVSKSRAVSFMAFRRDLDKVIKYIASSRPTARNLFFSLERMRKIALINRDKSLVTVKKALFSEAQKMIEEDRLASRNIGRYGAKLINNHDVVLTICNAGILATIDYGTALGVIYRARQEGKKVRVFACETRPMLQGARLTTWELKRKGVEVTLICDSMAAALMKEGKISKVIAGADRIAANGDTANKIGTYSLAVLSHYHKIPFYIAAPESTFDLKLKTGREIPIEQRDGREMTQLFFKHPIAAKGTKVYNPAFDITDAKLITSIITDKGIIKPPYNKNIRVKLCR